MANINSAEICSKKCQSSCCRKLIFLCEYVNPALTDQLITKFPFFELGGIVDTPYQGHHIRTFICNRWDSQTHFCKGYGIDPRPPLCEQAGTTYKPSGNCLLYDTLHPPAPQPPSRLSAFLSKHLALPSSRNR